MNSQNSRNQCFTNCFCLMIEKSGSGSIPLTNGSGSGSWKPKNIRFRIRNTGLNQQLSQCGSVADRQTYKCRRKKEFMKEYDGAGLLILLELFVITDFLNRKNFRRWDQFAREFRCLCTVSYGTLDFD